MTSPLYAAALEYQERGSSRYSPRASSQSAHAVAWMPLPTSIRSSDGGGKSPT